MEPTNDPSMIPPPLRTPRAIPKVATPNAKGPVETDVGHERPDISGMIAAVTALMLILMLILMGGWLWVEDKSKDSNPKVGGQANDPLTEGVIADENAKGSSLENERAEQTNEVSAEPNAEPNAEPYAEPHAEPEKKSDDNSTGNRDAKPNEATLSLVPNRQNSVDGSSQGSAQGNPSNGDPGTSGGLDLDSTKGMNPFVGEGKPAASTVFVIDVSGSMWNSNSIPRVMNALNRAIDQLSENQTFCVLLFDENYYSAPFANGLIPGLKGNKQKIKRWLSQPPIGVGTDPMAAMSLAIGYKPERIVLLSDGEFDPNYSRIITAMNQQHGKSARIDCVGLMEDVFVLRDIADLNNGIYYQAW